MAADGSVALNGAAPIAVVGFAGGGGLCDAFKAVTTLDPSLAMNHWDVAIFVHQKLFPKTEHFRGDIFDMNPLAWRPGEPIRFGWFSPDCTDHSKAKGGVPKTERIRGLAWSVIPWAKLRQVQTIMLENVEEWWSWGPIYRCADDWRAGGEAGEALPGEPGHPIKPLRGSSRALWVRRMNQAGYWVEKRELVTADYGVPTTRKRLYLICEWVGAERLTRIALGLEPSPIRWAPATHASRKTAVKKALRTWVGFDTCAEWAEPCPSIFLDADEVKALRAETGRSVKRPLVPATLKRVARGLDRYVISAAQPFIVPITHQGDSRAPTDPRTACADQQPAPKSPPADAGGWVRDPLRTVTSVKGGEFALVAPTLANVIKFQENSHFTDPREPLHTAMSGATRFGLVTASMANLAHGDHEQGAGARVRDVADPLNTISAGGGDAALITGFLAPSYSEREGQAPRAIDVTEPYPTAVPTGNGGRLVAGTLVRTNFHSAAARNGIRDVEEPIATVTGDGGIGLVAAHLGSYYGTQNGFIPDEPMNTATGKARHALTMAWLEQANTGMTGHDAREPVSTVTGRATQQRLIEARLELDGGPIGRRAKVLDFLWAHFGVPTPEEWAAPSATMSARRKFGLVLLPARGETPIFTGGAVVDPSGSPDPTRHDVWMIVDIGLRMLLAKELARATGLSDDHDMSSDCFGRPVSKTHQTMMIGNMVPREPAASLIRTQCPDLVTPQTERAAA